MIIWGDIAGFNHEANGMTMGDITAAANVASKLDEVIIFRSSGPWCKRWIDWGYPTKNFHVKGKSSDWGPHAGLVPYDGIYSKVGADDTKAREGTAANQDGLNSGFAGKVQLTMSRLQIARQAGAPEGGRTALVSVRDLPNSRDLLLVAQRSGKGATRVTFRAVYSRELNRYYILVWPFHEPKQNPFQIAEINDLSRFRPFEVMTSNEVGANSLPLTGDYDLMSICPTWGQYGSQLPTRVFKPGIFLNNGAVHNDQTFEAGVGMDNVLDPRFHTMGQATAASKLPLAPRGKAAIPGVTRKANLHDFHERQKYYQQGSGFSSESLNLIFDQSKDREHQDMGNLTPRILRCINELNLAMGATGNFSALRRVHHNAESHRNKKWKGITEADMRDIKEGERFGDGFPLTAFHPRRMVGGYFQSAVCTIENYTEFRAYAREIKDAGFFVPRNWIWNVDL